MSQRRSNAVVGNGQWNGALEYALRTDVLTTERVAHVHVVNHQDGQQHHGKQMCIRDSSYTTSARATPLERFPRGLWSKKGKYEYCYLFSRCV